MVSVQLKGVRKLKADAKNLAKALSKKTDLEIKKQASLVMKDAKTKRFRSVAGATISTRFGNVISNPRIPPIAGILTRRSGHYVLRIGPPRKQGRGRYEVTARVPYAATHEDDRPVLTAALKAREDEIEKAVGVTVHTTIRRNWG